jgi:hypothetical protein
VVTSNPADRPATPAVASVGVAACGAIAADVAAVASARGWPVEVKPLPPLLHNHPERIAAAVELALDDLAQRHDRLAVGYADCGTYGVLDEVCRRRGLARLGGAHCYDVYAGSARVRKMLEDEPGTYLLTDFLALSFRRTILAELGLDRHPQLRDDYFGHYTRAVWLAQRRTTELEAGARAAAATLGLPLQVVEVGLAGLEAELTALLTPTSGHSPPVEPPRK